MYVFISFECFSLCALSVFHSYFIVSFNFILDVVLASYDFSFELLFGLLLSPCLFSVVVSFGVVSKIVFFCFSVDLCYIFKCVKQLYKQILVKINNNKNTRPTFSKILPEF